jgi:hypothetical protein
MCSREARSTLTKLASLVLGEHDPSSNRFRKGERQHPGVPNPSHRKQDLAGTNAVAREWPIISRNGSPLSEPRRS